MADYLIQDTTLTKLADTVRKKAGMDEGLMTPEEMRQTIDSFSTDTEKTVIFYDYDGTVLHSYSVREAKILSELPAGPSHEGLNFAGWTHSLCEVNAVSKSLDVGAMYSSDTLNLSLRSSGSSITPNPITFVVNQKTGNAIQVNWGDGVVTKSSSTGSISLSRTFYTYQDYNVTISCSDTNSFIQDIYGFSKINNEIVVVPKFAQKLELSTPTILAYGCTEAYIGTSDFAIIPNTCTTICQCNNSNLTKIIIPNSVTTIKPSVFSSNKLETIVLSENLCDISTDTFDGCENLSYNEYQNGLYLGMTNNPYAVLMNAIDSDVSTFTLHTNAKLSSGLFSSLPINELIIPDGYFNFRDNEFLGNTSLQKVIIPKHIRTIPDSTFQECTNLQTVVLPEGLTSIGSNAFMSCAGLTSITLPSTLETIGSSCFDESGLLEVVIPDGVKTIDSRTFSCPNLTHIVVPSSVSRLFRFWTNTDLTTAAPIGSGADIEFGWNTSIPSYAFSDMAQLTSVTLPDTILVIGDRAFYNCTGLANIILPSSLQTIGEEAFYGCIANINLPSNLTAIGTSAFQKYETTSLTIPDKVQELSYGTFYQSKITKLTIGSGVVNINNNVFFGSKITSLIMKPITPPVVNSSYALFYSGTIGTIYVPDGSVEAYKVANHWSAYADKIKPISEYTE